MRKFAILIILGGFFVCFTGVQAAELNEQVDFYVDIGYDAYGRNQVTASLKVIGDFIYFYIDNEYWDKLNITQKSLLREALDDLANEFDNVIYPKERAVFGSEWTPGIDNDTRITFLIVELIPEAGGYFNTFDEYPKSRYSSSNEREMLYYNVSNVFRPQNKAFLAHEFQHLITFYQKTVLHNTEEEVWLNEARSEYAPTVCGYNDIYFNSYLADRVDVFLDYPSDSLTEWQNTIKDYGVVNLFMHYLVDHYGTDTLTRMTLNDKIGIESIDQALADLGYTERFSDIFADWLVANYLNDCQVFPENRYCYLDKNLTYQRLHVDYSASYSGFPNLIVSRSSSTKDWSGRWYRFRQTSSMTTDRDTFKLVFDGSGLRSDFRVPYIVTDGNQTTVQFISLTNQQGMIHVPNFDTINKSVIIMPFNQFKESGFYGLEPLTPFSFTASSVANVPIIENNEENQPTRNYPDGSLIRAKGDYRVYIIKDGYRRWVQSAEIFNHYGHLRWQDIIEVDSSELTNYTESWLIRAVNDSRVYEVNADGTKHWLNMTAEEFAKTGRLWNMVYIINSFEREFYWAGANVRFSG